MLNEFLGYIPEHIKALEEAVAAGDADKVQEYGHSIKGSAGMLSADRASALALGIETSGRNKDITNALQLIGDLKYEISRLKDFYATL